MPRLVIMEHVLLQHVPQQRSPLAGASRYEQGLAGGTSLVHATRKTLQGHRTVCGGDRIESFVSGRFDSAAADACPGCVAALTPAG